MANAKHGIATVPTTTLTDLARLILDNVSQVETFCNDSGLPLPSFDEHAPAELSLPPEVQKASTAAIDASMELRDLLTGPAMCLRPVLNATSLQAVYKYEIAQKVPRDGMISYADLARATNLEDFDVRRIVRFAMFHHRLFMERCPGMVSHSAASRYLSESADAQAGLGFMFDECYQAFAHTVEALQKYRSPNPHQTGWAIANDSDMSMWDYHSAHPILGERAARAMNAFSKGMSHDTSSLVYGYDWAPIDARGGLVADLGGADGHASAAVARVFPRLRFVVQELPEVVAKAKYKVPDDVAGRVKIVPQDFFEAQKISADVYLIRQVLHNWGDEHCIKILRAIAPAMKPGNKILVNDLVVQPPGVLPQAQERHVRSMDMIMMSLFNSRERERSDWETLFMRADERFANIRVWKPQSRSPLALIEATWTG